jgi:uncharacterized SAM-binding protein YcdF (DUF218 family)
MVEIIIVLGNRNKIIMEKRVNRAIEYFKTAEEASISDYTGKKEIKRYILFSGGSSDGKSKPEGAIMMRDYSSKLIDEKFILVEDKSKDTIENLEFSKKLIEEMFLEPFGYKPPITICTSSFHIKRTIILAKLILNGYPLKFIHTNETISEKEDTREAIILRNTLDDYASNILQKNVHVR